MQVCTMYVITQETPGYHDDSIETTAHLGPPEPLTVPRQRCPVDACQIRKVTACADLVHRRGPDQSMVDMVHTPIDRKT